ncbi:MAG TPA: DUF4157 domain-containing protein [Steroidobacteraceae bacterium]|nr:DUF4157 domain-containing protein [Steroidobacteraceae bacterium]
MVLSAQWADIKEPVARFFFRGMELILCPAHVAESTLRVANRAHNRENGAAQQMSWIGRTVPLPEAIGSHLESFLGKPVGAVRIVENSLFARLHGRAVATTRRGRIYLRGTADDFFSDPWLMLHEFWHVIGQWETRALTIRRYLMECVRNGYWNNRFEVEARNFADRHVLQLRKQLRLHQ